MIVGEAALAALAPRAGDVVVARGPLGQRDSSGHGLGRLSRARHARGRARRPAGPDASADDPPRAHRRARRRRVAAACPDRYARSERRRSRRRARRHQSTVPTPTPTHPRHRRRSPPRGSSRSGARPSSGVSSSPRRDASGHRPCSSSPMARAACRSASPTASRRPRAARSSRFAARSRIPTARPSCGRPRAGSRSSGRGRLPTPVTITPSQADESTEGRLATVRGTVTAAPDEGDQRRHRVQHHGHGRDDAQDPRRRECTPRPHDPAQGHDGHVHGHRRPARVAQGRARRIPPVAPRSQPISRR